MRTGSVRRSTKETDVEVAVDLDGTGVASISTGIGFLDHMLELLARHSRIDLTVKAKGDLHIDHHHTTEDVGIALGQAVKQALGDMKGITRYADVHVPMDEALTRAAVELAKDWRTDRYLRRLEAMMIVADAQVSLVLTGTGDVLEPEAGVMGIGSGGNYALAAARAMIDGPLDAEAIVRKAMDIAADICVYTNRSVTIEMLESA